MRRYPPLAILALWVVIATSPGGCKLSVTYPDTYASDRSAVDGIADHSGDMLLQDASHTDKGGDFVDTMPDSPTDVFSDSNDADSQTPDINTECEVADECSKINTPVPPCYEWACIDSKCKFRPSGTVSCDDDNACTEADSCQKIEGNFVCIGVTITCEDKGPCSSGECLDWEGCVYNMAEDNSPCVIGEQTGRCIGGECVPDGCTADCAERECGPDGCGGLCGVCGDLYGCADGMCICMNPCSDVCCAQGEVCALGGCCSPDCEGKTCGDNGCGGTCGTCNINFDCVVGKCDCENWCNTSCCSLDDVCVSSGCCTPACNGKVCGGDGCGGSCGACPFGYDCVFGTCKCLKPCLSACCMGNEVCFAGSCCTPNCDTNECGPDGCGGTCGGCGPNSECVSGSCKCLWSAFCEGSCCAPDEVCFESKCCIPDCGSSECGDNGCGGSCGTCESGKVCLEGKCQNEVDTWVRSYGDNQFQTGVSGRILGDGTVLLLGHGGSGPGAYVARLGSGGNILWQRHFQPKGVALGAWCEQVMVMNGFEFVLTCMVPGLTTKGGVVIKMDIDNNIYWSRDLDLVGPIYGAYSDGNVFGLGTGNVNIGVATSSTVVRKLNSNGDSLGSFGLGTTAINVRGVVEAPEGLLVFGAPGTATSILTPSVLVAYLAFDATTSPLARRINVASGSLTSAVTVKSGGAILAGCAEVGGKGAVWLGAMGSDGSLAWQKLFKMPPASPGFTCSSSTEPPGPAGVAIRQLGEKTFIVASSAASMLGDKDIVLFTVNLDGELGWARSYGGNLDDYLFRGQSLDVSEVGQVLVVGTSSSFGNAGNDAFVMSLNPDGTVSDCPTGFGPLLSLSVTNTTYSSVEIGSTQESLTSLPLASATYTSGGLSLDPEVLCGPPCVPDCGNSCDLPDGCGGVCNCSGSDSCTNNVCN